MDETPETRDERWPRTVEEAAEQLLAELGPDERKAVAALTAEELALQHFGLGLWVRNRFRIWYNEELLADCARWERARRGLPEEEMSGYNPIHADDASAIILRCAWERARSSGSASD